MISAVGAMGAGLVPSAATASPLPAAPLLVEQAPLLASTISGLSQGSRGDAVRALQQALIDAGVPVGGGADGVFGPMTRSSVEQFQAARGLSVTGTVDEATAQALTGSQDGSGGGSTDIVGLSRGAEGPQVERLQEALIAMGVWLPSVNGRFDASTERGVGQFQRWNGLGVTGTVTPATAKALRLTDANGGPAPAPTPTEPASTPDAGESSGGDEYVGITRGARGNRVADVQRALIDAGVSVVGGADGVFGPKTQAALVTFQRQRGLSPTGVVGADEVMALGLSGGAPVTPAAGSEFIGLAQGARGGAVKQLQNAMITAGVTVRGGADGIFGPATKQALVSYQSSQGIAANGVVDAATVERLGLGSGSGPAPFSPAPAADEAPAPSASGNPYVGLKEGDSGPLVKEVQIALERFGFVIIGGADGSFGPATTRTLKAFQSVNDIPQNGVVTERGANIMQLGSGVNVEQPGSGGGNVSFQMERFPMQGRCAFGDTWHAPRGGGRLHVGTDIIGAEGNLLYAVVDGEISKLYWDQPGRLHGNGLRLEQPDGTWFTYLHMQGFAPGIELGTQVKAGDVIGWNGNTGSSATPHLHFEIHPGGGDAINPYPYLKAIDDCENTTPQYQSSFA